MADDKKISELSRVPDTGGAEYIEVVKGGGNYRRKANLTATTAPTVNDDQSQEYSNGSPWFDVTTGTLYICKDPTNGAAVWSKFVGGEGGTWAPTASDVTNDATVTLSSGIYSRVGDIVNFSLNCIVEMAVNQPSTSFTFNLPIASAFTDSGQLKAAISGTLQDTSFDPPSQLYRVIISAGTGVASVSAFNGQDVGATYAVNILGQYIVV